MLKPTNLVKSVFQLLFWAAIAWLLYTVRAMVIYLIIAALLTFLGKPMVRILRNLKFGKFQLPLWVCSLLTIVIFFSVIGFGLSSMVPAIVHEVGILSKINYNQLIGRFENEFMALQNVLTDWDMFPELTNGDIKDTISGVFNLNTVTSTFGTLVGGLGNISIAIFSISFILFFFLKEEKLADSGIDNFIADKYTEQIRHVVPKVKTTLTRYIFGLTIQLVSIFLMVWGGLTIVGFEDVLIIALFAATMNVIPYVGPLLGIGFGLFLGLGQELAVTPDADLMITSVKLLSVFAIVQVIDNVVSQPIIFSNSINAHPLEIFIVISVAGTLAGIAGMVVAVPLYSILRIVAKEFDINVKFIQTLSRNA